MMNRFCCATVLLLTMSTVSQASITAELDATAVTSDTFSPNNFNSATPSFSGSTPISFTDGVVDAVRWTSVPHVDSTLDALATPQLEASTPSASPAVSSTFDEIDEIYAFSQALVDPESSSVPEPSSLIVWSLLGLTLGAGWWRRRKRAA
jgi:hypothetical protein